MARACGAPARRSHRQPCTPRCAGAEPPCELPAAVGESVGRRRRGYALVTRERGHVPGRTVGTRMPPAVCTDGPRAGAVLSSCDSDRPVWVRYLLWLPQRALGLSACRYEAAAAQGFYEAQHNLAITLRVPPPPPPPPPLPPPPLPPPSATPLRYSLHCARTLGGAARTTRSALVALRTLPLAHVWSIAAARPRLGRARVDSASSGAGLVRSVRRRVTPVALRRLAWHTTGSVGAE